MVLITDVPIAVALENAICGWEIKKFVVIVMKNMQENPGYQKKEKASNKWHLIVL